MLLSYNLLARGDRPYHSFRRHFDEEANSLENSSVCMEIRCEIIFVKHNYLISDFHTNTVKMASETVIRPVIAGYDVILDQSEINRISIIIGVFILNRINKSHAFAPEKWIYMWYNIMFARLWSYLHTNQISCLYGIYIV